MGGYYGNELFWVFEPRGTRVPREHPPCWMQQLYLIWKLAGAAYAISSPAFQPAQC